jgi:phosphoribosylanthranilate isomerase
VLPNVKFCGIARPEDALAGISAGADYLGVVLGPSPRQVTVTQATLVVTSTQGAPVLWVGVFTDPDLGGIAAAVRAIGLDVVQLHVPVAAGFARDVTRETGARVWCVGQVIGGEVTGLEGQGDGAFDAVVFDASKDGRSGGLGVTFDWQRARRSIDVWRGRARIAVAGGLNPANVGEAVRSLDPDIVDVSSGVERAPGVKEHQRMRDFVEAVRGAHRS